MIDIKGYEGRYAITSCGRVWSYLRQRFLRPGNIYHGYLSVGLYNESGKRKMHLIHRLVAEAYIPNPNGYDTVDHIDFNNQNNNVNNLRWISRADNIKRQPKRQVQANR